MPIYTRFGDSGDTRLFDGERVRKHHLRVSAYGDIDELNSVLGIARSFQSDPQISASLVAIQQQLMAVGSALANPSHKDAGSKAEIRSDWVTSLENGIDHFDAQLPALQRFILPGGCAAAAHLHLARTVCRRAERRVVELSQEVVVEAKVLSYLNRLSDLLFVLARVANYREGMEELLW